MILNASAAKGSLSSAWRVTGSPSVPSPPLVGMKPSTGGTSSGPGR